MPLLTPSMQWVVQTLLTQSAQHPQGPAQPQQQQQVRQREARKRPLGMDCGFACTLRRISLGSAPIAICVRGFLVCKCERGISLTCVLFPLLQADGRDDGWAAMLFCQRKVSRGLHEGSGALMRLEALP